MNDAPASVEAYLAALPADRRSALEDLRRTVLAAVPGAEERFSYGIPTYRYRGKMLVAFGAGKHHLALYAVSAAAVEAMRETLGRRTTGKGTVRFTPDDPLPEAVVRRMLKMRTAEIDARADTA